ncbi:MAG: hypothetical protein WC480_01570 [Patescibacteria group bacterium]
MEVKDFQKKVVEFVDAWDKKRKVVPNEQLTFYHIIEELGELARDYVNNKSRPAEYKKSDFQDAIGDSLMQIIKLAALRGLDIEKIVLDIIERERQFLESEK